MRIDESGEDNFARAVDLKNSLAVLLQPGIAQGIFSCADRNDLAAEAEDGAVFDDAEFFKAGTAAWAGCAGGRLKGKKLADVRQKQRPLHRLIWFSE